MSPAKALQLTTQASPSGLLLIIFIHGFKGDDKTFGAFPQRVQGALSELLPDTVVESIVFPAYETKGELIEAVAHFVNWLRTLTTQKEQGVVGSAKIVLCGHSMGGLLAADSLLELSRMLRTGESSSLWPRIVGCISFDTPYLGLQPTFVVDGIIKVVFTAKTTVSTVFGALAGLIPGKAAEKETSTEQPPQSSLTRWSEWASSAAYAICVAVLAGAAVGSSWYKQEDLGGGYNWLSDHMKFVSNLWDEKALQNRVDNLIELEKSHGILFRTLYVLLPPLSPQHISSRTFILLPKIYMAAASHFLPATNGLATDEVKGHTGMFAAATNDGYNELELTAIKFIRESIGSYNAIN